LAKHYAKHHKEINFEKDCPPDESLLPRETRKNEDDDFTRDPNSKEVVAQLKKEMQS
jgi:hypothetical protein